MNESFLEKTKIYDEVDFYLIDLKSRFDKIKPNEYYLSYSGGVDSHFLYWFIKEYLKRDDIEITEINFSKNIIEIRKDNINYCFDENKNFYPIYDLSNELLQKIDNKYNFLRKEVKK